MREEQVEVGDDEEVGECEDLEFLEATHSQSRPGLMTLFLSALRSYHWLQSLQLRTACALTIEEGTSRVPASSSDLIEGCSASSLRLDDDVTSRVPGSSTAISGVCSLSALS